MCLYAVLYRPGTFSEKKVTDGLSQFWKNPAGRKKVEERK